MRLEGFAHCGKTSRLALHSLRMTLSNTYLYQIMNDNVRFGNYQDSEPSLKSLLSLVFFLLKTEI